ncbi:hypothetical protein Trydic_g19734 [Trypoxylus dichotomus]
MRMHHQSYENTPNRDPGGHLKPYTPTHSSGRSGPCGNTQTNQYGHWRGRDSVPESLVMPPFLSVSNDEMVRKYSFERKFFIKLNNKKECKGESPLIGMRMVPKLIKEQVQGHSGQEPNTQSMGRYPSVFQEEINAIQRCTQCNFYRNY